MRLSRVFQIASAILAGSPGEAAFVSTNGNRLAVVVGTLFNQQTLNALRDAGVTNIPIDLAGAVNDNLQGTFGGGPFGAGILIGVRYTQQALTSGAQGYFSITWLFPSPGDAARALTAVSNYVRTTYKRDEDNFDLIDAVNLTTTVDMASVPPSIFATEQPLSAGKGLLARQSNTVCHNPSGFSFTNRGFNKNNPSASTDFNQCESCLGGTRNGC